MKLSVPRFVKKHKLITAIIVIVCIGGGYYVYTQTQDVEVATRYMIAAVEKGTVAVSVSGSGQVSASSEVDIKPKASGDVVSASVTNGQEVMEGDVLATLNARAAQKSVRDAQVNLDSARLSLEKLTKPADALSILQAENTLAKAQDDLLKLKFDQKTAYDKAFETKKSAEDSLKEAYEDGFNTVSNAFLDFPGIMTGIQDMLFDNTINSQQSNIDYYTNLVISKDSSVDLYKKNASDSYNAARSVYEKNFDSYRTINRTDDPNVITSLIDQTYAMAIAISDALKDIDNFLDFVVDKATQYGTSMPSLSATHQSQLNTNIGLTNGHVSALLAIQRSIKNAQESIVNAERDLADMDQNNPLDLAQAEQSVVEKQISLEDLKSGSDLLDVASQELTVRQRQNSLYDAQETLADYVVCAPFDGVIADPNVRIGEQVSASTVIAKLITNQKIAEITLNEIDVAQLELGQRATLIFDAVESLTITGEVVEIDAIGTVTQNVVSFGVKIAFDTQDERVKSGMSVTATIITDIKQNILTVPNAAVKSQGGVYYVEAPTSQIAIAQNDRSGVVMAEEPQRREIEVGLVSDTMTEIVSGLSEGDQVITQTINASAAGSSAAPQQTNSLLPTFGGGGGFRSR